MSDNTFDDYVVCVILPATIHHALELEARANGQSIEAFAGSLLARLASTHPVDHPAALEAAEIATNALREVERLRAMLQSANESTGN